MRNEPAELIRDAIKATMRTAGVSGAALSREAFIPRSTLARKLVGASEFTVTELIRVADALRVPLRDLIAPADAA